MDHAEEIDEATEFLPVGTRLLNGTYEITEHLGAGGFGLTYLADDQIGRTVVLKECFPASLCRREGSSVRTQTAAQQENFDKLIKNFMNEARQLAKLKHPNVVPVLHFFEENDTAYMSLEHVKGDDLSTRLRAGTAELTSDRVIEITTGILRALSYIHSRGLLHRDIAPDNIIINEADQPVLIDFGASRNETAQAVTRLLSQQLRAVKDGYSPQEFYMPGRQHTPASDLYSLAATVYTLITNKVPVDAYNRLVELSKKEPDPMRRLYGRIEGYPEQFLKAIDTALSLLPKDRPQSAEEMRSLMAPNSGNVTPLNAGGAEHVDGQAQKGGSIAPRRPSKEPTSHISRPPSVVNSEPVKEFLLPRFDPAEPTRMVKPRVLTRSSEPPRAGTVPMQPDASTVPHSAPPRVPSEPARTPEKASPVPLPGEPTQPHHAPINPHSLNAPVPATRTPHSQVPPEVATTTVIVTRTSMTDKVLRGMALAVIAAGAFVFIGGQTTFLDDAAQHVQAEVGSFAAGEIVVSSDLSVADAATSIAPREAAVPVTPSATSTRQQTLEFAAATPTPVATPPVVPTPVGVQTGWAANGWAVTLDLPLMAMDAGIVFAPSAASPYPAGTILVSVGGTNPDGDPTRVAELAAGYFSDADPDAPRLPVSVRNPTFDSRGDGELRVDVSRVVEFGAFTLAQRPEGEGWSVTVATARPASGLRDGDVIRSESVSGLEIGKISDLEAGLAILLAADAGESVLVVERSGAEQRVTIPLTEIAVGGGAG